MIEIAVIDRQETVEIEFEYEKTLLEKPEHIYIPMSIITDTDIDSKKIGVFSYFRIHSGLNNVIGFTISDIIEWYGGKPNKRANNTNDKILSIVNDLSDKGYLTYLSDKNKSSFMKCKFNVNYYYEMCSNGYAVLYLDEIEKIINYEKNKKNNSKKNTVNNLLLVFAYLRNKIRRRPNELKPEERSLEMIAERKKRIPDAYEGNIDEMAEELGIHRQTLSKIIDILEYDLNLIVTDKSYRTKNDDGEYRTLPTIFANAYKREDKYLLVAGEDYSRTEIKLKAENMKRYYHNYKIDKRKRKI